MTSAGSKCSVAEKTIDLAPDLLDEVGRDIKP